MTIIAMMAMRRLTNKTNTTIIIVVFLSLLGLLLWVSSVFPKKYDLKMNLVEYIIE